MKELKTNIPEGYEIDKESSTFECIKFKPIRDIRTTEDLYKSVKTFDGYSVFSGRVEFGYNHIYSNVNKSVFLTEKEAKSSLAMAQISQLMPYYGGIITDKEWEDIDKPKYIIERFNDTIITPNYKRAYCYLAFHTEEQRDSFLNNNYRLVKDYLMLD